ncbi:unnamed protein product [Adineta steineri]|uniref:Uncharacterized protein n=1 Tax=Adineta steineri TaxID=433720 RepID=A0A814G1W1_9BILA|nr:unnamed protein product [Adineta steineri]CAF3861197.1 unnamed protein product [Adineta steineri]
MGPGLDLVAEDDQQTHMIELLDPIITDQPIDDNRVNINQPHNNRQKDELERQMYLQIQSSINAKICAYNLRHPIGSVPGIEMIVCEKRVYDPFFSIVSEHFSNFLGDIAKLYKSLTDS